MDATYVKIRRDHQIVSVRVIHAVDPSDLINGFARLAHN